MIREIMHDMFFLSLKSETATMDDRSIGTDLIDTLAAHSDECVGMAANMIGFKKRIIVFDDGGVQTLMYNPEIIKTDGAFKTEEGCLSLEGTRKTKRYKSVKVQFEDKDFKRKIKTYKGFTAQIIQHEIDHLNGIVI